MSQRPAPAPPFLLRSPRSPSFAPPPSARRFLPAMAVPVSAINAQSRALSASRHRRRSAWPTGLTTLCKR